MLTIQNSAIDYISGFFTVLDAYMSIEYDLLIFSSSLIHIHNHFA